MDLKNKIKSAVVGTGLTLASLVSFSCSNEARMADRGSGKMEVTMWKDFNGNGKYDSGEDTGAVGEDPIYFANKQVRIRYVGNIGEKVNFHVVDDWPNLVVENYISSSGDGVHRLEDNGIFMKSLNKTIKTAGRYIVIAKPLNGDSFVYGVINSAEVPNLFDEMREQTNRMIEQESEQLRKKQTDYLRGTNRNR